MIAPDDPRGPPPAPVPSPVDPLPKLVVEARRLRGLTPETLARSADVPMHDVTVLEDGGDVPASSRAAIRDALGLGCATGHVRPPATSPSHARSMLATHDAAVRSGGIAAFPDVSAWMRAVALDETVRPALSRAVRRTDDVSDLCVCLLLGTAFFGCAGLSAFAWPWPYTLAWMVIVGIVGSLTGRAMRAWRRAKSTLAEHDATVARRDALAVTGYVVAGTGLSVLDARAPDHPEPVVHPARTVYSVEVTSTDETHVTIVVGCAGGVVRMEWLPRSQPLLDLVSRWVDPTADAPWAPVRSVP